MGQLVGHYPTMVARLAWNWHILQIWMVGPRKLSLGLFALCRQGWSPAVPVPVCQSWAMIRRSITTVGAQLKPGLWAFLLAKGKLFSAAIWLLFVMERCGA